MKRCRRSKGILLLAGKQAPTRKTYVKSLTALERLGQVEDVMLDDLNRDPDGLLAFLGASEGLHEALNTPSDLLFYLED